MAAPDEETVSAEDKEKLDEIVEKDARSGRAFKGFWYYLTSGMGVFMVLFYMYCAAVPVDTQYFLGLYVLITYVMVFLFYPMWRKSPVSRPYLLDIFLALVSIFVVGYYIVEYEDIN
jgi:TRAP-type uncharacterized transport system fused permease subunit